MDFEKLKEERRLRLEKLREDLKDPNSEASIKHRKYIEELAENARKAQLAAEELYIKICSYDDFEDFMSWLSEFYDQRCTEEANQGKYIDSIDEQWDLVKVAETYGRELTEDELEKIDNPFLGSAYYFKGYVFGVMNGQGSVPWYTKWDTSKFGPEQLSLF